MSHVADSLISAHRECTEWRDVAPDKEIRIGHIFKEWIDDKSSTALPHWVWYEVVGEMEVFRYRRGNIAYYERFGEIKVVDEPVGVVC